MTDTMVDSTLDDGLLHACRIQQNGAVETVLSAHDLSVNPDNSFAWVHLQTDHTDTTQWLQELALEPSVIELLTATDTRPRTLSVAGGTLVNLRGVNTNPGADPEDMVSIRIWFNDGIVVSTRRRKLLSVQDLKARIEKGDGPKSTGDLVSSLIERLTDRIEEAVEAVDQQMSELEAVTADLSSFELRKRTSILRRQIASIRRYLAPQREALGALSRKKEALSEENLHQVHVDSDRMIRYVEELDLARERALLLQEELTSKIAEQQNSRMYLLSIVAAIFLPLSFLTGLFGMNVSGLPGTENPSAFAYVSIGMSICAVLLILVMRWKKWM